MLRIPMISRRSVLVAAFSAAALPHSSSAIAGGKAKYPLIELLASDALPDQWIGKSDAPITIIEYSSLTCPHCATFHVETFPKLSKDYIESGKVRFSAREFPLDALAAAGAMLARSANDRRMAIVELLFAQQKNWAFVDNPLVALENVVKQAGIGADAFKQCLNDRELYQNVLAVRQRAADKFAVDSTPTFFINGDRRNGEISVSELDKLLAPYLPKAG